MTPFTYEELYTRFIAWASEQEAIRAAILIGSRARKHPPADEFSDADILIITHRPEQILHTTDWLDQIQPHWMTFLEQTADGDGMERRVMFEPGLDVDFIPETVERIKAFLEQPLVRSIIARGHRILLDKDGLLDGLEVSEEDIKAGQDVALPTAAEFHNFTHDYWYHTVWAVKRMLRGELWTAKQSIDSGLKWPIVRAMEWHAKATHGPDYDTWYKGRFLDKWADPRFYEQLQNAYAYFNEEDLFKALTATMNLFRTVTSELADLLDLPYPTVADQQATRLVQELHNRLPQR
ncbi:MAG TPA: aminoglycoside 6-adenylyltransferase [Bacilli bacterium]|nr:aminoglycoside 6-adenylyltransferase [Bacilli bacterium]